MNYEQRFRAIGRVIDKKMMRNVSIMEFEGGAIIAGLAPIAYWDRDEVHLKSLELTEAQIVEAAAHLDSDVTPAKKRAWPFG